MTWRIVGRFIGEDARLVVADDGSTDPPDARGVYGRIAAAQLRGQLEMSPTGPFIAADMSDDAHLAEVVRQVWSEIEIDTGPSIDWAAISPPQKPGDPLVVP